MTQIFINILLVVHVFVSLLILLVVLMQRPKSEGLGAAFGGGMTENLFGAQTTNVLTRFTVWLGGAFFVLTLLLSVLYSHQTTATSKVAAEILKEAAVAPAIPVVPAVPAPASEAVPAPPSATPDAPAPNP